MINNYPDNPCNMSSLSRVGCKGVLRVVFDLLQQLSEGCSYPTQLRAFFTRVAHHDRQSASLVWNEHEHPTLSVVWTNNNKCLRETKI